MAFHPYVRNLSRFLGILISNRFYHIKKLTLADENFAETDSTVGLLWLTRKRSHWSKSFRIMTLRQKLMPV